MTKKRLIIYIFLFVLILSALIICIFALIKKNPKKDLSYSVTPTPIQIIEITWPEAINLIQTCQIKAVFQKRNLDLTLTHKDNRVFKTTESKFNDIFNETNHLRSDCNDLIQTITE